MNSVGLELRLYTDENQIGFGLPPGGHALVPYRFEEPSSGLGYVYVYDSNVPGKERRVEFDLDKDQWLYKWHVPSWSDWEMSGDSNRSACSIFAIPLDLYRQRGIPYWNLETIRYEETKSTATSATLFSVSGMARPLFIDDQGNRFGWEGSTYFEEIPGATYMPIAASTKGGLTGYYYIPSDVLYDVIIQGFGEGTADILKFGNNHVVAVTDMEVVTDTTISLEIAPNGTAVALGGTGTSASTASTASSRATIVVSRILTEEDRTVIVGGVGVGSSGQVVLTFDANRAGSPDVIQVKTNEQVEPNYSVSLIRSGGAGLSTFGYSNLSVEPGASVNIAMEDWSNLDTIDLGVDVDGDGVPDDIRVLTNQSQLGSLSIEASRSIVTVSEEPVELTIWARDQLGNPVANGTPIELSSSLGELSSVSRVTSGGLIYVSLTPGAVAGKAVVIARSGEIETLIELDIAPEKAAEVSIAASPATLIADGISTSVISTVIRDAYSNPVPNQIVNFETTLGSIVVSATTDANGIATILLTSGIAAGTAHLTATAGGVTGNISVQFVAGPPASIDVSASPAAILANGSSTSTVTALVKDVNGNPAPGQTVAFATTLGAITNSSITDADGKAVAVLTSAQQVGQAQVTASLGEMSDTTAVAFTGRVFTGSVFVDINQNGEKDAGEPGIANVEVEMTLLALAAEAEQATAAAVGSTWRTQSDAQGNYTFAELPYGQYRLTLYVPTGYAATTPISFTVTISEDQASAPAVGMLSRIYLPAVTR